MIMVIGIFVSTSYLLISLFLQTAILYPVITLKVSISLSQFFSFVISLTQRSDQYGSVSIAIHLQSYSKVVPVMALLVYVSE
jgi:hypothetical protein